MNLIIQTQNITPDMLREIADNLEATWLHRWHSPARYQILSDKEALWELYKEIERLRWLDDLYDIAIKELETKFPTENIKAYFEDIKEYHELIVQHANEARKVVVAINKEIDLEYKFVDLPAYSVIT